MKKRSFKQFSSEIEKLSKTEEGKLKGGFNSMALNTTEALSPGNGRQCNCSATCKDSGLEAQ